MGATDPFVSSHITPLIFPLTFLKNRLFQFSLNLEHIYLIISSENFIVKSRRTNLTTRFTWRKGWFVCYKSDCNMVNVKAIYDKQKYKIFYQVILHVYVPGF